MTMLQFPSEEPAEALLAALGEALELVDCGVMLLDAEMRVRFVNGAFARLTTVEPGLVPGVRLRDLLGAHFEAEMGSRPDARMALNLPDASQMMIGCRSISSGGYVLTCNRLSQFGMTDEPRVASANDERLFADLRFDKEVLEDQAAHLASLAEESDANARRAEQARSELEHEVARRRQLEAELRRLATTDALTGTLNRRQFFELGQSVVARMRLSTQELALLMIDIDHFKLINDRHGHPVGDAALKHVVLCLRTGLRQTDLIGRVGGEEFAIILPATPTDAALRVAERLRTKLASKPMKHGATTICMTVSIGLAMARPTDDSLEQIIARADTQLYRAKESGRNTVCVDGS